MTCEKRLGFIFRNANLSGWGWSLVGVCKRQLQPSNSLLFINNSSKGCRLELNRRGSEIYKKGLKRPEKSKKERNIQYKGNRASNYNPPTPALSGAMA